MKTELRKKLYEETKEKHGKVENAFNFSEGISNSKLEVFYKSILNSRIKYQKLFQELEKQLLLKTFNSSLISSLQKDLKDFDTDIETAKPNKELNSNSFAIGVFYVFAGSAMGARLLRKMALEHNPPIHSHYITELINTSKSQMKSLGCLLSNDNLIEKEVIEGANEAFSTINKYANLEYKRKHKSIESA
ncbi:hypothetical protein [Polaribacter sp. P097]|uniref:hypothetical protein n=1 Tax=Polaribacter sp. P097 TaxID=3117398 RepID=UPI002FE0CBCA